jgi:hypothetical protein
MDSVSALIDRWTSAREELAAIERAEHPDIVDQHGRTWTWRGRGDLYRHCGNAAPDHMINDFGLPAQSALDNPNYDLCDVCLDGRKRNVPDCDPSWDCSHTMHHRTA